MNDRLDVIGIGNAMVDADEFSAGMLKQACRRLGERASAVPSHPLLAFCLRLGEKSDQSP